jgi:hypothetical protein
MTVIVLSMSDIIELLKGQEIQANPIAVGKIVIVKLHYEDTAITAKGACERILNEWNTP